jgi:DHA2 family methylenomycin A resistance protein-like MFS transporter
MAAGLALAAAGLALLSLLGGNAPYAAMLPSFLLWGVGLGFLTPAVVAAAVAAVPASRAGLAASINNAGRQAGGAIGIALAGAIAGAPAEAGFVGGFHAAAIGAATLYVVVAVTALALLRA